MTKIWHTATHSANIGDAALIQGLQTTLRQDWEKPVDFINDSLMEYDNYFGTARFDLELVKKINSSSDMLIIGGGGMMDGGRGNSNTGFAFNLPFDLWDKIKVPVVFYALGHNLFRNQRYWHSKKLLRIVDYIKSRNNMLLSVRNDGSLERLRKMFGSKLTGVHQIPDPGLYVPLKDTLHHVFLTDKLNILIQLAGDNPFNRFRCHRWKYVPLIGKSMLKLKVRQYFNRIGKALQKIAVNFPVNFILCPHLVRDFSVLGEFVNVIPTGFCRHNFNSSETLRGFSGAPLFFDLYRKADIVVGMRGHSEICGVGVGTPTIAISSHDKISGFMNSVGLSDRVLEIDDSQLTDKLTNVIATILSDQKKEKQRLSEVRQNCRKKSHEFHRKMLELFD